MTKQNWAVYSSGCEFQATFTVTCPDEIAYVDPQSLSDDNSPSCEKIGFSTMECKQRDCKRQAWFIQPVSNQ